MDNIVAAAALHRSVVVQMLCTLPRTSSSTGITERVQSVLCLILSKGKSLIACWMSRAIPEFCNQEVILIVTAKAMVSVTSRADCRDVLDIMQPSATNAQNSSRDVTGNCSLDLAMADPLKKFILGQQSLLISNPHL